MTIQRSPHIDFISVRNLILILFLIKIIFPDYSFCSNDDPTKTTKANAAPPVSIQLDEKECAKKIQIPAHGFIQISCMMIAPDSLQTNLQGSAYLNNPFTVMYTVTNTGKLDVNNIKADITLSKGLMTVEQMVKDVSSILKPGQSAQITWQVRALSAITASNESILIHSFTPDSIETECTDSIFIPPLKILLLCNSLVPDSLKFDIKTRSYQPNPFTAQLTLSNKRSTQVDSVIATIILPPELELSTGEQATKPIGTMYSGHVKTLSWQVQINSLLPAGKDVQIILRYQSSTDSITDCVSTLHISSAGDAILSCNIAAPDTIHYLSSGYSPDPFTVKLRTSNTGYQDAKNVHAYVIQDQRFNIVGKADRSFTILPVGSSDSASFALRVQQRVISGYDTLRILLIADGISPTMCEHIIWVEAKLSPTFSFRCSATIDSLIFDPKLHDYIPNPFNVTLETQNIGNADALDCRFVFIGPSRFTLSNGSPIHPLGKISIGEHRIDQFQMHALLQQNGILDTIVFQNQSKSTTGEIIITECRVPIYVPPAFGPQYSLHCTSVDSLHASSGGYSPNPFQIKSVIKNSGNGIGFKLQATIALPSGFTLSNGEQPTKYLSDLSSGDSIQVTWNVLAIDQQKAMTTQICISVTDQFGVDGTCCHQIYLPAAQKQVFILRCTTRDTLHVFQTGYIENPFTVQTTIMNNAAYPLTGITASIVTDPSITLFDPAIQVDSMPLLPSQSITITWRMSASLQQKIRELPFTIKVSALNEQPVSCYVSTIATALPTSSLQIICSTSVNDTLHFSYDQGAFEQDPFIVRAQITNPGSIDISNLKIDLAVPPGVALAQNEQPEKIITLLHAGSTVEVEWKLNAMRTDSNVVHQFRIRTEQQISSGQNIESVECNKNINIQGAPLLANLSISRDLLCKYADRISVPVMIECPGGTELNEYSIQLHFESSILRFIDAIGMGELKMQGWSGPNVKILNQDVIELRGSALNQIASYKASALFMLLTFEAIFGSGSQQMQITQSAIRFESAIINKGNVHVSTEDGLVTVSGSCIEPLEATKKYQLLQNTPNPFNPQTVIVFTLPEETIARLEIFDGMGKQKGILLNKILPEGKYSVPFDGSIYSSGAYYYRLVTPKYIATKRMILLK